MSVDVCTKRRKVQSWTEKAIPRPAELPPIPSGQNADGKDQPNADGKDFGNAKMFK